MVPPLLNASGERWLVSSLLTRERHGAMRAFGEAQASKDAQRDAMLREAERGRTAASQRATALANQSEAAAELASAQKALDHATLRINELERSVATLEQEAVREGLRSDGLAIELARTQMDSVRDRTGLKWRLYAKAARMSQLADALKIERKVSQERGDALAHAEAMHELHKKNTMKALTRLHSLEVEQMRKAQEAQARNVAAGILQRFMRRRSERQAENERRAQERMADVERLANVQVEAARTAADVDRLNTKFRDNTLTLRGKDGVERMLRTVLAEIINSGSARLERKRMAQLRGAKVEVKYRRELRLGRPEDAALGIVAALKIDLFELFAVCHRGIDGIREEWETYGTEEEKECMRYVLDEPAGGNKKEFINGVRDVGRNGERLADFGRKPEAVMSQLNLAHVAALRIYTTACFSGINMPLRDPDRTTPHPFPATVFFAADGIKRLRASHSAGDGGSSNRPASPNGELDEQVVNLWRGMKDVDTSADFEHHGGSEQALMSTTSDPSVAVAYGQSEHSLLFKIVSRNIMTRGADISFLSAFPGESEYLYPPLTYLQPTGRPREVIRVEVKDEDGVVTGELVEFAVVEVEPCLA